MALFEDNNEDRSENASAYRREEFRRQGTVALSRELLSVGVMFAVGASLYFVVSETVPQFRMLANRFFRVTSSPIDRSALLDLRVHIFKAVGWIVVPAFVVAMLTSIAVCAAQVGFHLTWEPIVPKWERLDPIAGLGRIFSSQGAVEAAKALLKFSIVGTALWLFIGKLMTRAGNLYDLSPNEGMGESLSDVSNLYFTGVTGLLGLAAFDYWYQRMRLEKQMKMTKREAKEEFKLREGDPLIRSRIRQIQRRIASKRMMEAVPKADAIVTNPTHLAVALKYDAGKMAAPRVVAKGAGLIAEKIKEIARANGVPIVENKPLARTLFKEIDIGKMIPRELFKAVAEVLAYVYRLKSGAQYG